MVKSKDLNNMFQNYIKRTKVSCAVSAPVLVWRIVDIILHHLCSFLPKRIFRREWSIDLQNG